MKFGQAKSSGDYLRRFVLRITAMGRSVRLRRQLAEIETRIHKLPEPQHVQLATLLRRECDNVARSPTPAMHGSQIRDGATANGLELGFERARSGNPQVRIRGIALWLALADHETRNTATPENANLGRAVQRVVRGLKAFGSGQTTGRGKTQPPSPRRSA